MVTEQVVLFLTLIALVEYKENRSMSSPINSSIIQMQVATCCFQTYI